MTLATSVLPLILASTLLAAAGRQPPAERPQTIFDRAVAHFLSGRLAESVREFDALAAIRPGAAADLWQRGIALYYVGRYQDCRAQFEAHRAVNPNDVENAAWHFLCVARAESPAAARAALLPVGPDPRLPMRQIYDLLRGVAAPDAVLAAAGARPEAQFYAQLYLGLYFDAIGNAERARVHIAAAAADRYAPVGGYMHGVAVTHVRVRGVAAQAAAARGAATDWPQLLGPSRNGVYTGPPLADTWPATGPRRLWQKSIGQGLAGPVVAGERLILFHRVANEEVVEALDARTGDPRWRSAYRTAYRDDFGFDEGPRAVPVVANGRVYTFGAEGQLQALDLATGKRLWNVDTATRFAVRKGFFGAAGSPLVEAGRVIANVGGKDGATGAGIVAFHADTGAVLWTATDHDASYSSPVGATFAGRRHAVFFTRGGLLGLDPATGAILFQRPWRSRSASSVNAATPLVIGELIFLSATYDTGATVLRVKGSELTPLWASDEALSNHYATSVHAGGYLFGFHGRQEFNPSLRAVDVQTGAIKWSVDRFHAGSVTLAGDRLLIARETGELMLAAASPHAFHPIAQAQILPPTIRALPALADGLVYLRNDNTLVCLDLRK